MPPKLSIVGPVLNDKDNLEKLLEQIDDFEYRDFEVVLVDGGSTDGTREIAEEHGVRIVDGPQEGMAAARNRCIEEAEGEYIMMVDADFRFPQGLPGNIEELFEKDFDNMHWQSDFSATETLVEKIFAAEYKLSFDNLLLTRLFRYIGDRFGKY